MTGHSNFGRELLDKFEGVVIIFPGDPAYEESRKVYNRMHDLYPIMIVQTMSRAVLKAVVKYGALHNIELAIRGGGHHIAGFGSTHGGILIDFSPFTDVHVDAENGIARILPGARLRDIDNTLCQRGYVIPVGTVSDTGIAGLTLGGGIGWLLGSLGYTCESLIGADVLLANGTIVNAEDPAHEELLWALRGGGGNFGIVLEFRFRLSLLPTVYCGTIEVFDGSIEEIFKNLIVYLNEYCPPNLVVAPLLKVVNGGRVCKLCIDFCLSNSPDNREIHQLESYLGASIKHALITRNYASWQSWSDEHFSTPMRGYWKSVCPDFMGAEISTSLLAWAKSMPGENCSITLEHFNPSRRINQAVSCALPLVKMHYGILFSARWLVPADDVKYINWVRSSAECMADEWQGTSYSNYTPSEVGKREFVWRGSERLSLAKKRYDPANLFRRNHNISGVNRDA